MKTLNTKLLAAASLAILMAATTPAVAETELKAGASADMKVERTEGQKDAHKLTEKEVKQGWKDTKEAISETAEDVSDATEQTYESIKATLFETNADYNKDMDLEQVAIKSRMTASGMLGEPVYNVDGERVAKIHDIILDSNGNAQMVVLADGDFTGLGKMVAYDYSIITKTNKDGDMISTLSEDMIDKAATFTYDREKADTKVRVMPQGGYSVSALMDGHLVSPTDENLADIDNISFKNGKADKIIVGYDKTLNMGGEKAAIAFNDTTVVKNDKGEATNFQLTTAQSGQFKAYKRTAVN